jgi:hypothetical protein
MSKPKAVLIFQEAAGFFEIGGWPEYFGGGKSAFCASDGRIVRSSEIKFAMIFMIARGLDGFVLKGCKKSLRSNPLRLARDGFVCLN